VEMKYVWIQRTHGNSQGSDFMTGSELFFCNLRFYVTEMRILLLPVNVMLNEA